MGMTLAAIHCSEHRLMAERLEESEARYRLLAENCADMIARLDLFGRYDYVSPACRSLFGQTEIELLGRLATDFAHPEDSRLLPDLINELVAQGGTRTLTFRRIHKAGHYLWVESHLSGLYGGDGRIRGIILTARDISARRAIEDELKIAATAFESHEGMLISDPDGRILKVNCAFTDITGYRSEEIVGQKTRILKSGRHDRAFYDAMWATVHRTGTWTGEIWNRRKSGEVYPEWLTITAVKDEQGAVTHYVGCFTDITKRKENEDAIEHLAFYDPLTRLPNRRLLRDRLAHALAHKVRHKHEGALLFIDLDNFKIINDSLGHDQGDLLLQEVATRLIGAVRESDTVARLGGDEFVVMLENLSSDRSEAATQARSVGEKILTALYQPYNLPGHQCECSCSIGVTLFCDRHQDVDELLKQADLAMYRAKSAGRNALRFFHPEMQVALSERAALESDLRHGIEAGDQFFLHYQPQMDLHGNLTGAEALLRWQHPQRGLVGPNHFISVAEETGLILPLGRWVLEQACRQLAQWAHQPHAAHLTVAVNVSAGQFRQSDFVQQVLTIIRQTGADPSRLKLELTESMLLDDVDDAIRKMQTLRGRGIAFSLDDFGTGYSSLAYLKRLPLTQIKIDRSFIVDVHSDPTAAAIAKSIVFLARSLGMKVIAEGVETEEQRDFLASHGCAHYQGFLFSRPLRIDEFEAYIEQVGQARTD